VRAPKYLVERTDEQCGAKGLDSDAGLLRFRDVAALVISRYRERDIILLGGIIVKNE
jgi:hypothetical protein